MTILALRQGWLPAAYSPTRFAADNRALNAGVRIKVDDGALHLDGLTYRGMTYTVESAVPQPDLGVLALDASGQLSPVFADAAAAEPGYEPRPAGPPAVFELPGRDRYLDLPSGIDPGIARLADQRVRGLATDFERALALEAYFRDSGAFRYSIEVDPGHAATDLAEWLLDPASPDYRTGYCEQFATAMAVMARLWPSQPGGAGLHPGLALRRTGRRERPQRPRLGGDLDAHPGLGPLRPHAPGRRRQPGHFRRPAFRRGGVLGYRGHLLDLRPRLNPPVSRPEDDEELTIPSTVPGGKGAGICRPSPPGYRTGGALAAGLRPDPGGQVGSPPPPPARPVHRRCVGSVAGDGGPPLRPGEPSRRPPRGSGGGHRPGDAAAGPRLRGDGLRPAGRPGIDLGPVVIATRS